MIKFDCLMNLLQNQAMSECFIKSRDVNYILLLLIQIWNQLLDSIDFSLHTHEWEIIVQVVQVIRVRLIILQEVALPSFLIQLTDAPLSLFRFFTHLNLPVGSFDSSSNNTGYLYPGTEGNESLSQDQTYRSCTCCSPAHIDELSE